MQFVQLINSILNLRSSQDELNILEVRQSFKTATFIESGPMPTPTKSQNTTILGSGDPVRNQWSHPSSFCYWRSLFAGNIYPSKGTIIGFVSALKWRVAIFGE